MLAKIKKYLTIFTTGLVAGILIFMKLKSGEDSGLVVEDAKLEGKIEAIDTEINAAEDELDDLEAVELTVDEVVDFWDDL